LDWSFTSGHTRLYSHVMCMCCELDAAWAGTPPPATSIEPIRIAAAPAAIRRLIPTIRDPLGQGTGAATLVK
jgi:hypothetical protein